jgi:hypothetical protein
VRKTTTDQHEIREWAARRNAHPVQMTPLIHDSEPAKLGFVFGDLPQAARELKEISWGQFFALFQLMDLVLAYDGDSEYELLRLDGDLSGELGSKPMQA